MTNRRDWHDLPERVRRAVEAHTGPVLKAESAEAGRNSELAATLWGADGAVFCKGVTADSSRAAMHRNELRIGPYLPPDLAPALLWHVEAEGWLVLGFEHVDGRHADLSPGSPDLPLVGDAVTRIGVTAAPPTEIARRPMAAQWARAIESERAAGPPEHAAPWSAANAGLITAWAVRAPDLMGGSALVHSDLNPANLMISEHARVIDWAWWRTGASWIDSAFLVVRLIAEGHRPDQAEAWAAQIGGFAEAPNDAVTAFAASVLRLWERRFPGTGPTDAARQWVRYRLESPTSG